MCERQDLPEGTVWSGEAAESHMERAYCTAGEFLHARLAADAEGRATLSSLEAVEAADVIVVRGCYDRVEQVLGVLGVSFTLVDPRDLDRMSLAAHQLLIVNCPGELSASGIARVRRFVEEGGSLFTTDWALKHVLEPAFPGVVAFSGRTTGDDVVRIEAAEHDNPFIAGVCEPGGDPLWWLEASSYPITILDRERVQVLLSSRELAEKYGEAPVAISFEWGRGEVLHMISHYYLQRSELRTMRHAAPAEAYAKELGLDDLATQAYNMQGLQLADVESAYSSLRLMSNVLERQQRRAKSR